MPHHQQRLDVVVHFVDALQHRLHVSRVEGVHVLDPGVEPEFLGGLPGAGRRRAQHQRDAPIPKLLTHLAGVLPPPIGEFTSLVAGGVVGLGLGVAQEEQRGHVIESRRGHHGG